jgi:hypothetical protein
MRAETTRLITFDKNDKLETGRKFFNTLQSRVLFLRSGMTEAILRHSGIVAFSKDILTIAVMKVIRLPMLFFKRLVGMGSILQVVDFAAEMIFLTSFSEAGEK